MANDDALELMRFAWATRRASFDAASAEKQELLTQAQEALTTAVAMCRDQGSPVSHAQAVHLLANVELDMGHQDRARSLWEEAIRILRGTSDVLQLAHANVDVLRAAFLAAFLHFSFHSEAETIGNKVIFALVALCFDRQRLDRR